MQETTVVKEKKPSPPTLDIKNPKRRSSALSLNSLHKKAEEVKHKERIDYSKMPKEAFTQAEFYVQWKHYISILNKQGDKMLGSILNSSDPVLNENTVNLTYPNAMMLEEVKKNQTHVLNYLRDKLKNYQISFNLILDEKQEKNYAYTPEEKYRKLKEINPSLEDFRRTLFLDI
jgi:DNA polymerase-3 subunit gamma/tau